MRRPLWSLLASFLALICGLTICVPGICGCATVIPGFDGDRYIFVALGLDLIGLFGIVGSLLWMLLRYLNGQRPPAPR